MKTKYNLLIFNRIKTFSYNMSAHVTAFTGNLFKPSIILLHI